MEEGEMTDEFEGRGRTHVDHVAEIVAAYVSNNHVARSDLPALIELVAQALNTLAADGAAMSPETITRPTKGEIEKSIRRDTLISFIDGKAYKALRRHLRFNGHTPQSYRARYGLPVDYPMVAPSYSERRSEISRQIGAKQRPAVPAKALH
jgi:predicted transcriptional regulator